MVCCCVIDKINVSLARARKNEIVISNYPGMVRLMEIRADDITEAVEVEKEEAAQLSKTQRQKQRHELSNPSNISPRLTSILAKRFPPDKIADHIESLLHSTRTLNDGSEIPDTRSIEAGLKLVLAYTVGTPVARIETKNINVDVPKEDVRAMVEGSPALKAELLEIIGESKG
jgi:hypothetical protein